MQAAAYLVYAGDFLQQARGGRRQGLRRATTPSLVSHTRKLVQIQRAAREARSARRSGPSRPSACARCCWPSRATCGWCCCAWPRGCRRCAGTPRSRTPCPPALADEASRSSRRWPTGWASGRSSGSSRTWPSAFCSPRSTTASRALDETRAERERVVRGRADRVACRRAAAGGIAAEVQGRPKHLYSIWKKMQGKGLPLERVFDLRALRVIVDDVPACYAALARVHELLEPVDGEFDDYIARPNPTATSHCTRWCCGTMGARSRCRSAPGPCTNMPSTASPPTGCTRRPVPAATPASAPKASFESRVAEARKAVMRQLLAWERDFSDRHAEGRPPAAAQVGSHAGPAAGDERIYVFTPTPPSSTCRRAARRWTSHTAFTPSWGTVAEEPAWTASWCP
jgi:GTP pyrophosphokinase